MHKACASVVAADDNVINEFGFTITGTISGEPLQPLALGVTV